MLSQRKISSFFYIGFLLVVVVHSVLVLHFLPFKDVFSNKPIVTDDYPLHMYIYNLLTANPGFGLLRIYVKHFAAGAFLIIFGEKFIELTLINQMTSFLDSVVLFKVYALFINLISIFLFYFCLKNFGLKRKALIYGMVLFLLAWDFSRFIHKTNYNGLLPFLYLIIIWLCSASSFYRYFELRDTKFFYLGVVFSLIAALIHPYYLFSVLPLLLLLILFMLSKRELLKGLILFLLAAIFLVPPAIYVYYTNGIYAVPLFHNSYGFSQIKDTILNYPFFFFFFLLGCCGLFFMKKNLRKYFLLFLILFIILGFFGYLTPLKFFQTQRFLYFAFFLLIIPSIEVLAKLRLNQKLLVVMIYIFYVTLFTTYSISEVVSLKLSTTVPNSTRELIDWIKTNTDKKGRILLEGSGYKSNHIYGGHYNAMFPLLVDREFATSFYPYPISDSKRFQFTEGKLYIPEYENSLQIEKCSCSIIKNITDAFNVHWIIVWSDSSISKLSSCRQFFDFYSNVSIFKIFVPKHTPNYFLTGNGTLLVNSSQIVLKCVTPYCVFKYCWHPKVNIPGISTYPYQPIEGLTINFVKLNCSIIREGSKNYRYGFECDNS